MVRFGCRNYWWVLQAHKYSFFLLMGISFLLQKVDPSTCLFMSGNADFELLAPALKWTVFP